MPTLTGIRHAWPEQEGFCLKREYGHPDYSFVHFFTSVEITLNGTAAAPPNHTCLIYRPGTPQYFIARQPLVHDWFHFSNVPDSLFRRLNLPLDTLLYPQQAGFITPLVQEMESEYFARRFESSELISLKMTELFIKLSRSLTDEYTVVIDSPTSECLRRLRSEVLLSLNHPWTVAEMAARIPLSESRFYTVYRSFYGTSPMDDLIRARMDAAKNALLFTEQTISSIADSLGYNNLPHFIRQFRKFTGMSPSVYRRSAVPEVFKNGSHHN